MAKIPEFLLRGLYVRNSLRKTDDGFEFQLKNEVATGSAIGALPLKVDRKPVPLADCSFVHGGQEVAFEAVTPENPVLMKRGEAVTIKVRGVTLRPGRHMLNINVVAEDVGELSFSINDALR
jgi:hypothetical protein